MAAARDPLGSLRAAAAQPDVVGVFWIEARSLDGGSRNQLGLPDLDASRTGIVDAFFPMSSNGVATMQRSDRGIYDRVEIEFDGEQYAENVVRFNSGGPNFKLYYSGATSVGKKFSSIGATRVLEHKVHVFLRRSDNTLELVLLDRNDVVVAAMRSVSVSPTGWHEQTGGAGQRSYGVIDVDALSASGATPPSVDEDAEWMVWRYAILPQLIETASQVGATELLAPDTRNSWLEAAGVDDVSDRWKKFDSFLSGLSLNIAEEGYGLTRGLTVIDIPSGAASEYLAPEDEDEDDAEVDDSGDAADAN